MSYDEKSYRVRPIKMDTLSKSEEQVSSIASMVVMLVLSVCMSAVIVVLTVVVIRFLLGLVP